MLYLLILIIGAVVSYFGHWWMVILVAGVASFYQASSGKQAFLLSSAAVTTLWLGMAFFLQSSAEVDLMPKIAGLFTSGSSFLQKIPPTGFVYSLMAIIAGLIGGWGGLSGYAARKLVKG